MKRNMLWLLSTLSVLALLLGYRTSLSGPLATPSPTSGRSAFSASASASSTPAGAGTKTPTGKASPTPGAAKAKVRTRTVSGSVISTHYGPVQVQLTVTGSKITKASVLQYPHDNSTDIQINNNALPVLTRETIQKQGAKIDMVSGATYTSGGYVRSLQSALDQARL